MLFIHGVLVPHLIGTLSFRGLAASFNVEINFNIGLAETETVASKGFFIFQIYIYWQVGFSKLNKIDAGAWAGVFIFFAQCDL